MNKKIIIGIIVAVLVVGIGGFFGYRAYAANQEAKKQAELTALAESIKQAQDNQYNAFSERINQTVAGVDVNSVDSLNAKIGELNNVTNDINADTIMREDQKSALNQAVTDKINEFNNQINALNQAAEAERIAKEQAEAEAKAKAAAKSKASSKKSSSSSSSSGSYSGGNDGGESAAPAESAPASQPQRNTGHRIPTMEEMEEGAKRTAAEGLAW